MVAKDRMPSDTCVSRGEHRVGWTALTHRSNNLRLQTILVLKSSSKVAHATLAILLHIGHLADVVEHVAGGEEEHHDQADCSPEVAVLDHRQDVG